jgi:deoxyribodipyrimidine photo-lyase
MLLSVSSGRNTILAIHPERIAAANGRDERLGRYVLYWMQQSQRENGNHALEYAAIQANRLGLPLLAAFAVAADYPQANLRHYTFMLEGLRQTRADLARRGVQLVVRAGPPPAVIADLAADAAMVVMDVGYLRTQRQWRARLAAKIHCRCVAVESDVVVPVRSAYPRQAYAARSLRPALWRRLSEFMVMPPRVAARKDSLGLRMGGLDLGDIGVALAGLEIDRGVAAVKAFVGGPAEARRLLRAFLRDKLSRYHRDRGDPSLGVESHMSPYLHFGQISPVYIALQVLRAEAPQAAKDAYLEELIVRRELSMNFVWYNARYDSFRGLPVWARGTLKAHAADRRPVVYTRRQLENAQTHDPYWNAAQRQMAAGGKMHNYMRMYWGKKIIEWSASPRGAFATALALNNKYELDGRDANAFAGVAWCFGNHDRPWARRPIFGTVRYMNAAGLERKFDMPAYIRLVDGLALL